MLPKGDYTARPIKLSKTAAASANCRPACAFGQWEQLHNLQENVLTWHFFHVILNKTVKNAVDVREQSAGVKPVGRLDNVSKHLDRYTPYLHRDAAQPRSGTGCVLIRRASFHFRKCAACVVYRSAAPRHCDFSAPEKVGAKIGICGWVAPVPRQHSGLMINSGAAPDRIVCQESYGRTDQARDH